MGTDEVLSKAQRTARDANDHPVVRTMARVGYAASGLIHLLIAWLALQLAMGARGDSGGSADQSGAVALLGDLPLGKPLLWVLVAGFAGLAIWQLTEAVGGWHGDGKEAAFSRIKAVSKAVVYAALGWTCATVARGQSASSSEQSVKATDDLLALPGGVLIVGIVGLVVIGVGAYHVVKGARRSFLKDLVDDPGDVAEFAGAIGYIAKGIALVVVGGLFGLAAINERASEAKGLGGALTWILKQPFGPWLLGGVALGLACYGVYSFFRARYTKV